MLQYQCFKSHCIHKVHNPFKQVNTSYFVATVKVRYLSVVHVLNYAWKWIVTWASGREDYMHIGTFHHVQVVSFISWVLIGS